MQHNVKFFIINLDRSPDRLAECRDKFSSMGISLERIPAVDGQVNDLSSFYDDELCRKEMGRSIQPGEVGCFLSHINAIQKFWESDAEYAVILEDDASPSSDFLQTLEQLIPVFQRGSDDMYAVNLGASDFKYGSDYRKLGSGILRCAHRFPMLATGILWSRSGAKIFLDHHKIVSMPYDNYLRFLLSGTNKAFSVRPPMVLASGAPSDIEARNVSKRRSSQNRSYFYFFFKQRRIIREKVRALIGKVRWFIR